MLTMTNGGGVVPSGPGPPGSCSAEAPGPIRGPTGQSWLAEHTWTLSVSDHVSVQTAFKLGMVSPSAGNQLLLIQF